MAARRRGAGSLRWLRWLCAVAGLANASAAKVTVAFTLAILLRANQNDSGLRLRHACETFRLKFQTIDFIGAPDADS